MIGLLVGVPIAWPVVCKQLALTEFFLTDHLLLHVDTFLISNTARARCHPGPTLVNIVSESFTVLSARSGWS